MKCNWKSAWNSIEMNYASRSYNVEVTQVTCCHIRWELSHRVSAAYYRSIINFHQFKKKSDDFSNAGPYISTTSQYLNLHTRWIEINRTERMPTVSCKRRRCLLYQVDNWVWRFVSVVSKYRALAPVTSSALPLLCTRHKCSDTRGASQLQLSHLSLMFQNVPI